MNKTVIEVQVRAVLPTSGGCAVFLGNNDKVFIIYVDQTVGKFETRPRIRQVRQKFWAMKMSLIHSANSPLLQGPQRPVIFRHELIDHRTIFEFRWHHLPSVGFHF